MTKKKFITIYEALKEEILDGSLSYGDQIPSENDLVQTYQASRETVRKALHLLVSDGMIQKIRGKGSIVIYQQLTEFPFADLMSFNEVKNERALKHATKVLKLELIPASDVPMVKDKLGLALGAKLWHIVRVRTVNGQVKILDEDYLVESIIPKITLDIAQQSIYQHIEETLGLEISYANKSITFEAFGDQEKRVFGAVQPPYTATVRGVVHLKNTERFQYTVSKHIATEFRFNDFSRRRKL